MSPGIHIRMGTRQETLKENCGIIIKKLCRFKENVNTGHSISTLNITRNFMSANIIRKKII